MKLKNLFISGALAASALGAVSATAAVIPGGGTNEFIGAQVASASAWTSPQVEGHFGANLWLNGSNVTIKVDVFGGEAGYTNEFSFGGDSYVHTGGPGTDFGAFASPYGPFVKKTWTVNNLAAGLLAFKFVINGVDLNNGANPYNVAGAPNFFASLGSAADLFPDLDVLDGFTPSSGKYVWLFLDDGGAGPDDNHDDLIVRLSIIGGGNFPEPATLGLLGLGLVGLGALRRRKTA